MSETSKTADADAATEAMAAGFVRILAGRVQSISRNPAQMREMVYELARIKLLEQFTHDDAGRAREILGAFDRAVEAVEETLAQEAAAAPPALPPAATSEPGNRASLLRKIEAEIGRAGTPADRAKRSGALTVVMRLAAVLLLVAIIGAAAVFWPRIRTQFAALSQRSPPVAQSTQAPAAPPPERQAAEPQPAPQPAQPSMPLPVTFGVYALSDGELQELKPVPGKVPDRRVAISAAINTPSATTVSNGDVKFIVFRPDGALDSSTAEVRVVARVSRAMGIDASGKAAMVNAGDSWVIRSMSFAYKVGPVEDQPRMVLLQAEQDGFALTPGRYVVVVRGIGYDFTVAGQVTDPDQCVERFNATNGAFYSPCPPPKGR
ncbi:hypothetical protein IC762_12690 [Bradyrhizobium genosp. L]|uniref:hypothetical protein n=1 Tax=Bradyrhizobium genosp. L TaxID=83637 RepID=UPI0018A2507B|nr:hypothetical protein [Bradyrhizobium genosp. L]QPF87098.1 hypothetical protein IC762_12690 [Bradyrhizobium genosp. L]